MLGVVDLADHRLPDRVLYPAAAVCAVALIVDAAVLGSWDALLRAAVAAVASAGVAFLTWLAVPAGLGLGDVKLLGCSAWCSAGPGGGCCSPASSSACWWARRSPSSSSPRGRAGLRTALPFGPPLLTGAVLAFALQGSF